MANKIILLLAGGAGAGKDTFCGYLREFLEPWTSVRQDAYAYTLKQIVHVALGVPWDVLNGTKQVKEGTYVYVAGEKTTKTVRQALQDVGEFYRQSFGHLIWASSVRLRLAESSERITIVTDARHPKEEIHWMRESCAEFGRVYAVRVRNPRVPIIKGHPSEDLIAAEPDSSFDFIVQNDSDLEHLRRMAFQVAASVVILAKTGRSKLKKKDNGFFVQCADGRVRFEPLPTADEADFLASHADIGCHCNGSHITQPIDTSLLSGNVT